jgi:hypothetical protein
MVCTTGQLEFEWAHLLGKLKIRNPVLYRLWRHEAPEPHPFFVLLQGPREAWEKTGGDE